MKASEQEMLVSDQSLNSYDFHVRTAGIDTSRFLKNPVFLHVHTRSNGSTQMLPIGNWKDLRKDGTEMYATPVFDLVDEFAAKVAGKYDRGVMRGASIGLKPLRFEVDEAGELWLEESILMEISTADIPSNANSVVLYDENKEVMSEEAVLALTTGPTTPNLTIQSEMKFDKSLALLGLSADAGDAAVVEAIKNIQTERDEATTKLAALEQAEAERQQAENITLVEQAITDRKITEAQKDKYVKLMNLDAETTKSLLADMTPAPKLKDIPAGENKGGGSSTELKYKGKTFEELRRTEGGLAELKANDLNLFKEMYEAEYGNAYQE